MKCPLIKIRVDNNRWFQLLCRTLTVYCALVVIMLLSWNWIIVYLTFLVQPPFIGFSLIGIAVALFFFKELIPFPIMQTFRSDGIITIRVERKPKQTESGIDYRRDMKHEPDSFIFPYIQEISIAPIINNSSYLDVRCYLPSALPYHLSLKIIYIKLSISGIEIKKQLLIEGGADNKKINVKESIILRAGHPNALSNLRIYLTPKSRERAKEYYYHDKFIKASLEICGVDNKGEKHSLSTNEWTTKFMNYRED